MLLRSLLRMSYRKIMASSSSSFFFFLLSLLSFFSFICSLPDVKTTTITIPLSRFKNNPSPDPLHKLTHLVSASLTRAKHIKNPPESHPTKTPLFPRSYGGYSIPLSFGTPPQTIPFIMDTGSDLVWFPCTHRYICKNCTFPNQNLTTDPIFIPKASSTAKIVGCRNPKCGWIHDPDAQSRCMDCDPNSSNCTQICPPYAIVYGSGSTAGLLLSETLDFPEIKIPNFVVGCSLFSSRQPSGIAGFGRGSPSLPSQLGLKRFSYCLVSHRFDDTTESTSLNLYGGSYSGDHKTKGLSYTPFLKNPATGRHAFSVYYYIGLRKITVGGKRVKIPYHYLAMGSDGNGGAIIDSGSTFTFMEKRVFDLVAREFENQVSHYSRASDVETITGLRPCFNVSDEKTLSLPELVFHFKGGAKMALPLPNYYSIFSADGVVCLTIVTDGVIPDTDVSGGPSIILGNYQQQNFYVEYDLENDRLGFREQIC
ncbi:PREDICTED: probable aspartyl protease At4g16563 [Nelumbo nucifera]|uniref:Peptidase A1 domain-containing protein n=2 Tax=Nelumbo nucifera TaxID=4432 RepID=A0A822ZTY0_NELNU|nr:PREDICTED: probable aspartyl protease At4g16563 [Nelumbo nucifera]DAD48413.1 TPA_asm: hypothetical protein HUJ06_018350 [Nelumbo nucifera]